MPPTRRLRLAVAVCACSAIMAVPAAGPALAQAASAPAASPPWPWLAILVPVIVMVLLQTALGFRFLGKQEGRTDSLEKVVAKLQQEREADLKGVREALQGMGAKLDAIASAAVTQDKGSTLLEYRLDQFEQNTKEMAMLRDAVVKLSATVTEQHRATGDVIDRLDRRVTNAHAQIAHLAKGSANGPVVVQPFPAE